MSNNIKERRRHSNFAFRIISLMHDDPAQAANLKNQEERKVCIRKLVI